MEACSRKGNGLLFFALPARRSLLTSAPRRRIQAYGLPTEDSGDLI
jgi:hypothetical protein